MESRPGLSRVERVVDIDRDGLSGRNRVADKGREVARRSSRRRLTGSIRHIGLSRDGRIVKWSRDNDVLNTVRKMLDRIK